KLDDRSESMILVGYHVTGAYKMYNPNPKEMIYSRDVIVDEAKSWDWTSGSSTSKPVISLTEDSDSDQNAETDAEASEAADAEASEAADAETSEVGTRVRSTRARDPSVETNAEAVVEASETGSEVKASVETKARSKRKRQVPSRWQECELA
ncbi:hypothetical protein L195_g060723, partial [Trifolium pratense]